MGLLLSVLVVCVGVLEVLACVRHFQDGYLPLWTPHCAVTSGYTSSYERWRKKPSDSCEFRSFDDVCGELNHTGNQSSENCLESSPNIRNGFTGKQIEKAAENNYPSADYCYQHSKNDSRTGLSPSIDDHREEVFDYGNMSDISAPSLEFYESELKVVNKSITNAIPFQRIPDIPHAEYDREYQEGFAAEFRSHSLSEKHTVSVGTQYEVADARVQNENAVPLPDSLLEESFVHDDGTEKCHISAKEIDVENEVPTLSAGEEFGTSPCGLVQRNSEEDIRDDILGGKQPTQHDIFRTEAEAEIQSSYLYNEKVYDTLREISLSAVGKPDDQVTILKGEPSVSVPDYITETVFGTIQELDQVPNTEIEPQIPSDFTADKTFNTGLELESQIPFPGRGINVSSSVLGTRESKPVLDVLAGEPSGATVFDTQLDGNIVCLQNESAVPTSPNCKHRLQSLSIPSSGNEETSVTPVEASTQHNFTISNDGIDSELAGTVYKKQVCSLEVADARKELPGLNIYTESRTSLSVESIGEHLETDTHKETEAVHSHVESSATISDTESTKNIHQNSEALEQNLEDVFEAHSLNERNLGLEEDGTGTQHDVFDPSIAPGYSLPASENEKQISIRITDSKQDVSESRLDSQTIPTDPVIHLDEGTLQDSGFSGSNELTQPNVCEGSSDARISSLTSVTPLTMDTSVPLSLSVSSPLTIDTSLETSASVTPLPTDHQPSLSPPKVPSTPKKSKADISWPTFFPGTPVIKRPSVSFATPEAVFTSDDQDLLRQYAEEASPGRSCLKTSDDNSTASESETSSTSTSEGKQSESAETPERGDSFEEEPEPIVYREKSPCNIVSGNDFSRKELELQRRRSYKQKRYSSATEIRARDEEAEDRSFSENNPGITRATSLVEPKKRYKKPAKSSSFEDALLCDIKAEGKGEPLLTPTTEVVSDVSVPEGREAEREETQQQEHKDFEAVAGETKERSDFTDCLSVPTERNEPKYDKSKPQVEEEGIERKEATKGQKEEVKGDNEEEEEYSVSEEQSSSQQKSPPKEAFWLIFSGEYTKAMSKDWHSGHFCCWQCDESLTGQRYVLRDDHPYCIKCYESVFANMCEECNKIIGIDSKDLSYKDKHWHEACFLCNKCRVSLVDKQFGSKADKIYCGNCYDAQFASRCDGCGEIFRAGTKKMEYKTRQWHEKCFCCCVCKTAIGTKSFIPREQEIYCATCYEEKFATRCVKCNKIITSGGVTYKNEPWHRECFTCTHCNTSLAGQRFTSRDEKPYCADCFGELFAKRCTACSKPITGIGGTRFISFEDRHWHNDCFICATCKTSLVGRGFITDADDIICPECAKQKLM